MYTITGDRTEAAATSIISLSGVASVTWRNVGRHRGTRGKRPHANDYYTARTRNFSLNPSSPLSFSLLSCHRMQMIRAAESRRFTYSKPLVVENLLDGDPMIYVGREHSLYEVFRRLANGIPEWRLHLRIQLNRNYYSRGAQRAPKRRERAKPHERYLRNSHFFPQCPRGLTALGSGRETGSLPAPVLGRSLPVVCPGSRRMEVYRLAEHVAALRLTRRHLVSRIVAVGSLPAP